MKDVQPKKVREKLFLHNASFSWVKMNKSFHFFFSIIHSLNFWKPAFLSILLNYISKSTDSFTFLLLKKKRRSIRINFQNLLMLLCWVFKESKGNSISVLCPFTPNKKTNVFFICLRTNLERPKNPESALQDQHVTDAVTAFFLLHSLSPNFC